MIRENRSLTISGMLNHFGKPVDEAWYPLRYHESQRLAYEGSHRFIGLDCGRGSGKTEISRRRTVRSLPVTKPWSDPYYFYALPTFEQARRVAWKPLLALIPRDWITRVHESRMEVETVFGSTLIVVGMDKPHRIEGLQYDGGVFDESCDQRPGAFGRTVMPALTHRDGWCIRCGVPKRQGVGAAEFKKFCIDARRGLLPSTMAYTWPSSDILTEAQLADAKVHLDERDFNEQFNANWEDITGAIFHGFGSHNIRPVKYNPIKPIIVGSDFNVDPMCWTLSQMQRGGMGTFDEIHIRDCHTQMALNELYRRYGQHMHGWVFMGDAAARARNTSATSADYIQIKNDGRFLNKEVEYEHNNPPRADRFAACNALFKNAAGEVRYWVDPKCENLILDLETRSYKSGTKEPDDGPDQGHMTDALGYVIYGIFPVHIIQEEIDTIYTVPGVF